jgi:uncharacterized protein involved in exopolysaccharide biosynthesis
MSTDILAGPGAPPPNSALVESAEDEISLLDLLQVVADNLRLLVLGPLAAGLIALGISFLVPPTYTAVTKFMPPGQNSSGEAALLKSLGALGGIAGAAAGIKNPNDQFVAFLKSNSIADALITRFDLRQRYDEKFMVDTRKELASLSRITTAKDGLITVEVDDTSPAVAAQLANAYVDELTNLLKRISVTEAQQRRAFFEKQLNTTKDQLAQAELAIKSSGINSTALKVSGSAVAAVAQVQAQIAGSEVKLAAMRGYLTESAPEFRQAQTELSALRAQLAKVEMPATAPNSADADYVARFRDVKYYEALFELFARQYELARVDEAREGAVNQVVDIARPPERKSKPKKALIAVIATLAAGFALLLFIFVRHALRSAAQTPESAHKLGLLRSSFGRALGRAQPR